MAEIVLVCGSRDWGDREAIRRHLVMLPPDTTVMHGAASRRVRGVERSADALAGDVALSLGLTVEEWPADWSRGRSAGFARNVAMVESGPDRALAFQRNGSRGTQHTIDEAKRRGIPVEVIRADG